MVESNAVSGGKGKESAHSVPRELLPLFLAEKRRWVAGKAQEDFLEHCGLPVRLGGSGSWRGSLIRVEGSIRRGKLSED